MTTAYLSANSNIMNILNSQPAPATDQRRGAATVADAIAEQIGRRAFFMMGTQHKLADGPSLIFNIRGCPKYNKIRITLDTMDTYSVQFVKTRKFHEVRKHTETGVYNDMLHAVIEKHTGLALSL